MTAVGGPVDPFPHLHVRPAAGWVNDPNGVGRWGGRWHVMFQWNPAAPVHGDIHWGHLSSADLLTWRDEGVALRPRPGGLDAGGVWSGVAVPEPDRGGVALVYSAVRDRASSAAVAVARQSSDGGWVQPDAPAAEHPDHSRWVDVRDPYLVEVDGHRLGILGAGRVATGAAPQRGVVLVYDADDLDRWTLLGELVAAEDLPAGMAGAGAIWECPQLVRVGAHWVLVVSWDAGAAAERPGPDGTVLRPMGVTGYVGALDLSGPVPRFVARIETPLDHGPDFYAPQLVADGDRVLTWGWSWEGRGAGANRRDDAEVAAAGWAGTLTFPREVVVGADGAAGCVPARELMGLAGEPLAVASDGEGSELRTREPAWTATAVGHVELDLLDEATGRSRPVWTTPAGGSVQTQVFVDGSIVEVFDARGSTTVRAYPAAGEAWRVRTDGLARAWTLWAPSEAGRQAPG